MPINNQSMQAAKAAGYSDEEITAYLAQQDQVAKAKKAGYSDDEINDFLKKKSADPVMDAMDAGYSLDEVKTYTKELGKVTSIDDALSFSDAQYDAKLNVPSEQNTNPAVQRGYVPADIKSKSIETPYTLKKGVLPEAAGLMNLAGLWTNAIGRTLFDVRQVYSQEARDERQQALKDLTSFGEDYNKETLDTLAGAVMVAYGAKEGISALRQLPTMLKQTPGAEKLVNNVEKIVARVGANFKRLNTMPEEEMIGWLNNLPQGLRGEMARKYPRVKDVLMKFNISGSGFTQTPVQAQGQSARIGFQSGITEIPPKQSVTMMDSMERNYGQYIGSKTLDNPLVSPDKNTVSWLDTFTKYRGLVPDLQKKFYAVQELPSAITNDSVKYAADLFSRIDDNTQKELAYAYEENTPLPEGTEDIAREVVEIQEWSYQKRSDMGQKLDRFPDDKISALVDVKEGFVKKLVEGKELTPEAISELQADIAGIDTHISKLEKLKFLHRKTSKQGAFSGIGKHETTKKLSTKPYHFMGRKFDTIRDAEEAGFKVANIASCIAETIKDTQIELLHHKLITQINDNEFLSAPSGKGQEGWETVDNRLMPAAKGRVYHPAIKKAIEQLTYSPKRTNVLVNLYDKLNNIGKTLAFYNPAVMAKNDLDQGWRAAGLDFFANIPKALVQTIKNDPVVKKYEAEGLFSTIMDYKPAIEELTKSMMDSMQKSLPAKAWEAVKQNINPVDLVKNIYSDVSKFTWFSDKVLRVACRNALENKAVTKGMSSFLKTREADIFMAAYGTVPTDTRHALNRFIFTPTYKISMARTLAHMAETPVQHRAQLLRHFGAKAFFKYLLPGIVGGVVTAKNGKKVKSWAEGHKIVVQDDKKETVFSISSPVLEMTKVMNRKPSETVYFNMAAVPQALMAFLNKNKNDFPQHEQDKINEYFKLGVPGVRDWKMWHDKDKTTAEKWVSQLALAYQYTRDKYKYEDKDHSIAYEILDTMDLIPNWLINKRMAEGEKLEGEYEAYQADIAQAYKEHNLPKIARLQQEAKEKYGLNVFKKGAGVKNILKESAKKSRMTREEYKKSKMAKEVQRILNLKE